MKLNEIEKVIRELPVTTCPAVDERILAAAGTALARGHRARGSRQGIERAPWPLALAKVAVAVAIVAVVGIAIFVGLRRPIHPVYALQDTVKATKGIQRFHIRIDPAGEGIGEAWAMFDAEGKLLRLRMNFPATQDGPKDVLWHEGTAEVLFYAKGSLVHVPEGDMARKIPNMLTLFDPRKAMEELAGAVAREKVRMEIRAGDPIILIVTSLDRSGKKQLLAVDPVSKLVRSFEEFEEEKLVMRQEYLEYDAQVDDAAFKLEPPAGTMRIDQTGGLVGLERGGMSDEEVTVQVARGFFEALARKDYEKAGQLFEGVPAAIMQERFEKIEVLRVVSVGTSAPHPIPGVGGFVVPVTVEVKEGGELKTREFKPCIRAVYNQPGRWTIHGGI